MNSLHLLLVSLTIACLSGSTLAGTFASEGNCTVAFAWFRDASCINSINITGGSAPYCSECENYFTNTPETIANSQLNIPGFEGQDSCLLVGCNGTDFNSVQWSLNGTCGSGSGLDTVVYNTTFTDCYQLANATDVYFRVNFESPQLDDLSGCNAPTDVLECLDITEALPSSSDDSASTLSSWFF